MVGVKEGRVVVVQIKLGRAIFYRQAAMDKLGPGLVDTEDETGQDVWEMCYCRG